MRSERGVSEVIGTILVLGITVVLFASILVWVTSMPTPPATIRADMDGELTPILDEGGGWAGARLSARHRGGETLLSWRTNLFVTVERESGFETETLDTRGSVAGVSYGIDGADRDWNAGETWSYTNRSVLESDRITLSVVDREASVIVWSEELHGPSGAHPPVFLEKWLDGDASTQTTRDTPRTGLPFGLYARVEDRDGDLNRADVRATFTFGPRATVRLYDDGTHGDHVANDGVFTRYDEADNMLPEPNWDGGIVILRAEDLRGRGTESRVTFAVIRNPDEEGGNGSSSLGPLDLFHRNEFQTFAIYNATEWDKKRWAANETRTFKKGEVVVVIVASQYLRNLDILNRFVLYNADGVPPVPVVYGEAPYNQPVGANTKPSSTHAFAFLQEVSDFYIFEHRFGTNSTAYGYDGVQPKYGRYPLEIGLRANIVPPPRNQFNTVDAITVTDANGAAPDFPAVEFFKDAAHTQPSSEFAFTDTMYVRVRVNTTDAGVSAGDVTISDYVDGVQIWRRPGTPPVGPITVDDVRHYAFAADLSKPSPDPWIPNRNAYGFQIKVLADRDEDYALSAQIVVRGPRWSLDIASAIEEYSHPTFGTKWYSVFNDNDRLWSEYLIESYQPSPSQQDPPWGGGPFFQSVFSDLDEDGDLDVAVGNQAGYVWWYRNTGGRGHAWEKFTVDVPASPLGEGRAVAAGRIDRDADNDLVVGTHNGKVYWYANDGLWTRTHDREPRRKRRGEGDQGRRRGHGRGQGRPRGDAELPGPDLPERRERDVPRAPGNRPGGGGVRPHRRGRGQRHGQRPRRGDGDERSHLPGPCVHGLHEPERDEHRPLRGRRVHRRGRPARRRRGHECGEGPLVAERAVDPGGHPRHARGGRHVLPARRGCRRGPARRRGRGHGDGVGQVDASSPDWGVEREQRPRRHPAHDDDGLRRRHRGRRSRRDHRPVQVSSTP